jgi:MFS family permease
MDDNSPIAQVTNDPFASVRIPEFRNLMLGRFTFIMALRMMSTLVGWWIYELTNNPFYIGVVGLCEFVPAFGFALYAGHVVDTSERRKLMLTGVSFYLLATLILLLLSTGFITGLLKNNHIAIVIYVVIFGTGIIRSFTGPTFSAMLARIVPRHYLQNATTWTQGTWLSASVTGHAMGGFLIAWLGINGTMYIVCSVLVISLLILWQIKPKPVIFQTVEKETDKGILDEIIQTHPKKGAWESMKEGLRFVFRTKEILAAFSLDMFAVLFGGAVAMVPVYAKDILKIGPIGFGWLNAAIDLGSIISVILLTIFPMKKAQGKKLLYAVAGFGVCIIIFGLSEWFILSFAAMLIAGMLDGISVVVRGTVMQLKTPDHMRGRVGSVSSMFVNSSNELGQFESGVAAHYLGVVPSVVFGGCMTLLIVIVTWIKVPTLRKFEY